MCRAIWELTDTRACPPQGARTQSKQLTSLLLSEDSDSQRPGVHGHMFFDMHKNGKWRKGQSRDSAHEIELVRC